MTERPSTVAKAVKREDRPWVAGSWKPGDFLPSRPDPVIAFTSLAKSSLNHMQVMNMFGAVIQAHDELYEHSQYDRNTMIKKLRELADRLEAPRE